MGAQQRSSVSVQSASVPTNQPPVAAVAGSVVGPSIVRRAPARISNVEVQSHSSSSQTQHCSLASQTSRNLKRSISKVAAASSGPERHPNNVRRATYKAPRTTRPTHNATTSVPSHSVTHHITHGVAVAIPSPSVPPPLRPPVHSTRGELRRTAPSGATLVTQSTAKQDPKTSATNARRRRIRRVTLQRLLDRENFACLQDHIASGRSKQSFIGLTLATFVRLFVISPNSLRHRHGSVRRAQFTAGGALGQAPDDLVWDDDGGYIDLGADGDDGDLETSGSSASADPQQKAKRKRSKRGVRTRSIVLHRIKSDVFIYRMIRWRIGAFGWTM